MIGMGRCQGDYRRNLRAEMGNGKKFQQWFCLLCNSGFNVYRYDFCKSRRFCNLLSGKVRKLKSVSAQLKCELGYESQIT